MPTISVLIPVFNEADSLEELHAELTDVADQHQYEMEIVFADDGSTDAKLEDDSKAGHSGSTCPRSAFSSKLWQGSGAPGSSGGCLGSVAD